MLVSLLTLALAAVGAIVILFFLLDLIWTLLQVSRAVLAPLFLPNEDNSLVKKYGSWAFNLPKVKWKNIKDKCIELKNLPECRSGSVAKEYQVVTGSTDGIGKAYACELARRGINIVLVSRSFDKLNQTQKEIEATYAVKTKIIQVDFALGKKAVEIVKEEIGKLPISILVNNVGKQYDYPMRLGEVAEEDLWDIIKINVGAATLMCRAFIEDMTNRGKGAIVNVSSGSELQPLPFMNVYAATKTYIKNFTQALRYEYASRGLTIQHLAPMFVATKMNHFSDKIYQRSLFVPDPESYARYAVSTLGKLDDSTGYWAHGIQTFLTTLPPEWIRMYIGGYINKAFRKEYLNSAAFKAKKSANAIKK